MSHPRVSLPAAFVLLAALGAAAFANDKSLALVAEARKKLRLRDPAAAVKSLEAAVAADAGDAEAQILYQDLLRRDQQAQTLLTKYRAAAAAKPEDPLLAFLATRLLAKPQEVMSESLAQAQKFAASPWPHEGKAAALEAQGRTKDAAAEHDAAVAASPREPYFRVSQARSLERLGQWQQAAEIWRLAAGLRPNDRALLMGLGEALRRCGALDDAVQQFETASKLDPTDPEPHFRIGLARFDGERYDDALKSYDTAIALDKGYVEPYCGATRASIGRAQSVATLARRDVTEADLAPALGYATKAVQADGSSAIAHVALGNVEEALTEIAVDHASKALTEYDAALGILPATDPERVRALLGKAYVLLLSARFEEAIAAADKAIGQDERCAAAYLTAGRAMQGKGEPDDAIKKYYSPGLKAVPDDAKLRHARGIALWDMAKHNDAKKDLLAAVAAEPRNGRFLLSLGEIYYQLKDYAKGAEVLVTAADIRPQDPATWRALGRTFTSMKKFEEAAAAFEEVVTILEAPKAKEVPIPSAPPPDGQPPVPGTPPQPPAPPPAPPPGQPTPPGTPPAPPPADPNAPPAGGETPADPAAAPVLATDEHLYLALLYADHLNKRPEAKLHARKWIEQGGTNPNLDGWVQNLINEK